MQSVWANEDKAPSIILLHDTTTVQVAWLRTKGKEAQNWWAQLCEQPVPGLTYRLLFKPGCLHPHRWHISLIPCLTSLKLVSGFPQRKALEKAERGSFSFLAPFGASEKKRTDGDGQPKRQSIGMRTLGLYRFLKAKDEETWKMTPPSSPLGTGALLKFLDLFIYFKPEDTNKHIRP